MSGKVLALAAVILAGSALAQTGKYTPPRTPDGQPDLQGVWGNNDATPLERPKEVEGRATRVRCLWSRLTGDSARSERAFSLDEGNSWETHWIMDFTRV